MKNSSRMAAVFLCLQCSYYLLLYHAKTISYISKRMFLIRNTHFDYIYLYTFKTSYRTRLNFFNQLHLLWKMVIRNPDSYLSVTIQFLTFDSRKSDSLNSTFAFRLALIKFLRTTISLSSNFVCDSFSLSVLGQALKRLVTVSSMCYHTSTSALSTSYSSRVFTPLKGWDISSWGGLHA